MSASAKTEGQQPLLASQEASGSGRLPVDEETAAYEDGDHDMILAKMFDAPLAQYAPVFGPSQVVHAFTLALAIGWFYLCIVEPPRWYRGALNDVLNVDSQFGCRAFAFSWAWCATCNGIAYLLSLQLKADTQMDPLIRGAVSLKIDDRKYGELDDFAWYVGLLAPWMHINVWVWPPIIALCLGVPHHDILVLFVACSFPAGLTCSALFCSYGMILVVWKASVIQCNNFLETMQTVVAPKDAKKCKLGDVELGASGRGGNRSEISAAQCRPPSTTVERERQVDEDAFWTKLAADFQILHRRMLAAWNLTAKPLYAVLGQLSGTALGCVAFSLHVSPAKRVMAYIWAAISLALCIGILVPLASVTALFDSQGIGSVKSLGGHHVGHVPKEALARYMAFMQSVQSTPAGVNLLFLGSVTYAKLVRAAITIGAALPTALSVSAKLDV